MEHVINTLRNERKRVIDKIIFLGDYFDSKHPSLAELAGETAEWLHASLAHEDRIHLIGNHDLPYLITCTKGSKFSDVHPRYWCPGFSFEKLRSIREHITDEDIGKLKAAHYEADFLFTHAGLLEIHIPNSLEHYDGSDDGERIASYINSEYQELVVNKKLYDRVYPVFQYGARMGEPTPGGVIWTDLNEEFEPVPGLNQIIGHTPMTYMRTITDVGSVNHAVDTANNHVYLLTEGSTDLEVIDLY